MTIERRLVRLEGRAAIGRGSVAVGWQTDEGMVRYGDKLLTLAEFESLKASSHVLITRRAEVPEAQHTHHDGV